MPRPATLAEWETTYNDLATALGLTFGRGVAPVDSHAANVAHANGLSAQVAVLTAERNTLRAQNQREAAIAKAIGLGMTPEELRRIAKETS